MPKTSRKDGILVMQIKKPYKMAIDGQFVDKKVIICKEINNAAEAAAFDLEQMFDAALFEINERNQDKAVKQISDEQKTEEENASKKFFESDCPPEKDIGEMALSLEMMIRTNGRVKISQLAETFNEIIRSGLICMDGGIIMASNTWKTIHREDKLKVLFWYSAFFVNPLSRLLAISSEMDTASGQGATKGK